jgi:hypothetical protein
MQALDETTRRNLIASFFLDNQHLGKRHTVLHFAAMKVPPKTVYRILQHLELRGNVNRKIGSGGHNRAMNGNGVRSLRTLAVNRLGVSPRKLALRYHVGNQPFTECSPQLVQHAVGESRHQSTPKDRKHVQNQELENWGAV